MAISTATAPQNFFASNSQTIFTFYMSRNSQSSAMSGRNTLLVVCDCPRRHKGLVHPDTRRRHRQEHHLPDLHDSVPTSRHAALRTTHPSHISSLSSAEHPVGSVATSDPMEINGDTVHQGEEEQGLPQHNSYEAESSTDEEEEFDTPPVLFESADEGDDNEEDEENVIYEMELESEPEDDVDHLLTTLGNLQSDTLLLAFTDRRNKTARELGCHLYYLPLQIPIEYKRYLV